MNFWLTTVSILKEQDGKALVSEISSLCKISKFWCVSPSGVDSRAHGYFAFKI